MKAKGLMLLAAAMLTMAIVLVGCKKKEQPAPAMENIQKQAEEVKQTAAQTAEDAKKAVETAAVEVEQTMCPVMDGMKINPNVFVEYKGKKVYFCCNGCKDKFEADPEKYTANLPQFKK
jgi:YHS domain-containing protein